MAVAGEVSGVFALITLPYAAWNYLTFEHWLPVSAALKTQTSNPMIVLLIIVLFLIGSITVSVLAAQGLPRYRPLILSVSPLVIYCGLMGLLQVSVFGLYVPYLWYMTHYLVAIVLTLGRVNKHRLRLLLGALLLASSLASWFVGLNPERYATDLALRRTGLWLRDNTPPDPDSRLGYWKHQRPLRALGH